MMIMMMMMSSRLEAWDLNGRRWRDKFIFNLSTLSPHCHDDDDGDDDGDDDDDDDDDELSGAMVGH